MKKIINIIIAISLLLSSLSTTFASQWYLETLLDLNYWIEEHNLELAELDNIYFKNKLFNKVHNKLKKADKILKREIIQKYRNWEYEYYQVNWIVKNYKNFIYHANQFFYYLKIEEQHPNYRDLDTAILRSYRNMNSNYRKVKNLIKR